MNKSYFTIYTIYRKKINQKDNQQENMLNLIYDVGKTKKKNFKWGSVLHQLLSKKKIIIKSDKNEYYK